jgi:hypothetical protein
MGYTHYWTQPKSYGKAEWLRLCENVGSIMGVAQHAYDIDLAWEHDETTKPPEVSAECIRFNGVGDDGHETFLLMPKRTREPWQKRSEIGWACCKTAAKPYDVVVTAVLAYLAAAGWRVSSDGAPRDWRAGVEMARDALPHLTIGIPTGVYD